ncbi:MULTISPECIES: HAD family hydrolase [Methylovorus]|uniref:HAD family hydrolase n=1 Tax=Methylovorus TaxID=81682 RepID=UPI0001EC4808|nr:MULTISPECIES: HAD-IA family hydrolase [Methylovorus]ADQ84831.1 phosphoglycolate phosphatase [Methylovorus sp. MP688]KAF0843762.1 phosphoglycolate phosphatase [Methylovorus glucosotrophus]
MADVILFDLDGTLVDTAPDLAYALNLQRERHGLPALPLDDIRPFASHGSRGLLHKGFGITMEDPEFDAMRAEYLALYDEVFARSPVLFSGMAEVLAHIENQGLQWGVVTNKPRRFTEPMMQVMGLSSRAACVVSGDDAARAKPYPDTLLLACEQMTVKPQQCLYIGDAERDIEAGRTAGMKTVLAMYGYLDEQDQPEQWGADATIDKPLDLIALIN